MLLVPALSPSLGCRGKESTLTPLFLLARPPPTPLLARGWLAGAVGTSFFPHFGSVASPSRRVLLARLCGLLALVSVVLVVSCSRV